MDWEMGSRNTTSRSRNVRGLFLSEWDWELQRYFLKHFTPLSLSQCSQQWKTMLPWRFPRQVPYRTTKRNIAQGTIWSCAFPMWKSCCINLSNWIFPAIQNDSTCFIREKSIFNCTTQKTAFCDSISSRIVSPRTFSAIFVFIYYVRSLMAEGSYKLCALTRFSTFNKVSCRVCRHVWEARSFNKVCVFYSSTPADAAYY